MKGDNIGDDDNIPFRIHQPQPPRRGDSPPRLPQQPPANRPGQLKLPKSPAVARNAIPRLPELPDFDDDSNDGNVFTGSSDVLGDSVR